ncbi:MAG: hypothetical protein IT373_22185 [Polyangiaceae bacterium]|nr:hypothetical protein [Polyangiaceae bacterium]
MSRARGSVAGVLALLGALGLGAGALGCAAPLVNLREGPREYVATDYDEVLKTWTREDSLFVFSELESALTVSATFESWDFRWAYAMRYAQDYRLTIPQRQRLLRKMLGETRATHEFFVALYGGNPRHNDLTKPDSAWIVRLIDESGNETAPSEVVLLRKPNELERRYYPYNTVWRLAFRIRFPHARPDGRPTISADAGWFGLRFAGPKGNMDLTWELEPAEEEVAAAAPEPGADTAPAPAAPTPATPEPSAPPPAPAPASPTDADSLYP